MTISRHTTGFGLSAIAQSFCRAVFNQVPSASISAIPAAQREAMATLAPEERDALAFERIEAEKSSVAVLKEPSTKSSSSVFVTEQSFPVLTKFHTLIESIEDKARQRVLRHFTDEEKLQLFVEEADYAREFVKFQKQVEVLNSKPGQWKIYLPCPPQKGPMCQRFEHELRRAVEKHREERNSNV